jgi:hypothetical protein
MTAHEPVVQAPPPIPAVAPAPPAAFHAVSEHDTVADESAAHKPVRRRHHEPATPAAEAPLQLVETQAPAASIEVEDDLPRRTRPRRRRGGAVQDEPLQLVETQGPGADGTPAP